MSGCCWVQDGTIKGDDSMEAGAKEADPVKGGNEKADVWLLRGGMGLCLGLSKCSSWLETLPLSEYPYWGRAVAVEDSMPTQLISQR